MKVLLSTCFLFIFPIICFSQTITPNAMVSSAVEYTDSIADIQISWTLGDFQTDTYTKDQLTVTQGFLQSNFNITSVVKFEDFSNIELKVFPNPVVDILNIQVKSENKQEIVWELINQYGSIIKTSREYQNNQKYQINFTSFESGIYFIRTFSKDGAYVKIFKIVYLN